MKIQTIFRILFLILNTIFWLIGLGMVTYVIWVFATNTALAASFLTGSIVFTYALIFIAAFITIAGLCGCLGGLREVLCCLHFYLAFMLILILVEAGIAIYLHMKRADLPVHIKMIWDQSNTDTRNKIQFGLQCCGFYNMTEYGGIVDSSCHNTTISVTPIPSYQTGCYEALVTWFDVNSPIWIFVLALIAFVQFFAMFLSCCVTSGVEKKMRVEDAGRKSGSVYSTQNKNGEKPPLEGPIVAAGTSPIEGTNQPVTQQPITSGGAASDDPDQTVTKQPAAADSTTNDSNTNTNIASQSSAESGKTTENVTSKKKPRWHSHLPGAKPGRRSCWTCCREDCCEV